MTKRNDEEHVIALACLTEDRDPVEQRAMIAVALRLDSDRASFAAANWRGDRTPEPPMWTRAVVQSYQPSEGKPVRLTSSQLDTLTKLEEKWEECEKCGLPRGAHWADDICPFALGTRDRQRNDQLRRVMASRRKAA